MSTYKVGDMVVCKSREDLIREGYNNARRFGDILEIPHTFCSAMYIPYGGKVLTISEVWPGGGGYTMIEDDGEWSWSDEMLYPYITTTNNNNKLNWSNV